MIELFGVQWGAMSPWMLAGIPAGLAVLLYVYRRRLSGAKRAVPSLLILKKLKLAPPRRKRFVPPPRFWVDLLIVLLLSAAASGLFTRDETQTVAIVIDNSLSMSATSPFDRSSSFLEIAKQQALSAARTASGQTSFRVFSTAPALGEITQQPVGGSELQRAFEPVAVRYSVGNLAGALTELSARPDLNAIWVFSDQLASAPAQSGPIAVRTTSLTSGTTPEAYGNLALLNPSFETAPNNDRITIVVRNFGKLAAAGRVRMTLFGSAGNRTVFSESAQVAPFGQQEFSLPIPENWQGLEAELETTREPLQDSLRADNKIFLVRNTEQRGTVLVGDLSPDTLGLTKLNGLKFRHQTPSEYAAEPSSDEFHVFHRVAPEKLPLGDALFILPDKPVEGIIPGDPERSPVLTFWDGTDPLTRYINFRILKLPTATPSQIPPWAKSIVRTSSGTILAVGTRGGKRYVVAGLELLPFDGSRTPSTSILLLNLLRYFGQLSGSAGYESTYVPADIGADEAALIPVSGGPFPIRARRPTSFENPGIVKLERSEGSTMMALNFIDPSESNVLDPGTYTVPPSSTAAVTPQGPQPLWKFLAAAVLLVLIAELLFRSIGILRRVIS